MVICGLIYSFYNINMAKFFDSTYDPRQLSGTSGAEVSDLRPEQAYDTDLRRVDEDARSSAASVNKDQERVAKFMRAARTAGKFRQSASIDEPTIRGKVARRPASINGSEVPTRGDSGGRAGSVGYAQKPLPQFGKAFV
jgi:hypothetical protein